jgi:hypothetical protein
MAHHHQIGLEARDEHEEQDTNLREIANEIEQRRTGGFAWRRKHRPRKDVQQRRAEQKADENLAKHRRLMQPVGEGPGGLGRSDDQREEENNLKRMGQGMLQ